MLRRALTFIALTMACISAANAADRRGVFFDFPVLGLQYKAAPSGLSGRTEIDGGFNYRDGDQLTFQVGDLVLGTTAAKAWVTPLDLVPSAEGDVHVPRLNNIGLLIQSLDRNGNIEDGIELTPVAGRVVSANAAKLNLDMPSVDFYKVMKDAILPAMNSSGGFVPVEGEALKNSDKTGAHYARTPEMARNQLRRTGNGIMRITNVKIPMRGFDPVRNPDAYVYGSLHRPVGPGFPEKVPVVMNFGPYGKDRSFSSICTRDDFEVQERVEDRYFSGNPSKLQYENHETVDTSVWVPKGYAVLRVDEAGIGHNPGVFRPWNHTMQENYVDAIEWAGTQPWSSGNVGTIGISYYAISQWLMAQHQPEKTHLKAMIPWEGAADLYRDLLYPGGLLLDEFIRMGFGSTGKAGRNRCLNTPQEEPVKGWFEHSFDDPAFWNEYTTDFSKVRIPFMSAAGVDNMSIHARGNVMAYRFAASKEKLLRVQTGGHIEPFYAPDGVADQVAFFDYWLKGIDNGIMKKPPVKIAVKTGNGGSYWAFTSNWPVPNTRYTKFYLDANQDTSGFKVDGTMPTLQLHPSRDVVGPASNPSRSAPRGEASATYSAAVKPILQQLGPPWFKLPQPCDSYGVSFATPPLAETITLAGHAKLVTWVSSSTDDMDIHASLRVYDENGKQVIYPTEDDRIDASQAAPIQLGRLKVSQRKLDTKKSVYFQPVHTHLEQDSQKLKPGDIVKVEVEIWPLVAEIKKGYRVVVDVQPYHGCGHMWPHRYGDYNTGTNTLYTGRSHESYIQLPIVSGLLTDTSLDWTASAR